MVKQFLPTRPMTKPCSAYSDHAAGETALQLHRAGKPARIIADALKITAYQARVLVSIAERRETSTASRRAMLQQWRDEGREDLLQNRADLHLLDEQPS